MPHIRMPLLLALLLSVLCLTPALAARTYEPSGYSAELPPGWKFVQEGELELFLPPKCERLITIQWGSYENPDAKLLAEKWANGNPVQKLEKSAGYISEGSKGERSWCILAGDGLFFSLEASNCKGTAAFLAGLKADKTHPDQRRIFAELNTPEVLDWLTYKSTKKLAVRPQARTGDPKETPEASRDLPGREFEGNGFKATVPAGWQITPNSDKPGDAVVFTSADQTSSLTVRTLSMSPQVAEDFDVFARAHAGKMNGKNIRNIEGSIEFTAPDGSTGVMSAYNPVCLFLVFSGESSGAQTDLAMSVLPQ